MNKFVSFNCIVDSVSSRKDRSLKVVLSTPEMNATDGAVLLALANQQGYAYLSPNALQDSELAIPVEEDAPSTKTPSQRLRACLWRLWEQRGKEGEFKDFYNKQYELFINAVKEKLE